MAKTGRLAIGPGIVGAPRKWWLVNSANRVYHGGIRSADAVNSTSLGGDASGRTYLMHKLICRVNQDGLITGIYLWVTATGGTWKFKVFRPNGANYDFIGECTFTPAATGYSLIQLSTPISAAPGDLLAVFIPNSTGTMGVRTTAGNWTYYADGDIITTNAFAAVQADTLLNLSVVGPPPFLAAVGDSILEGHHTAAYWHSRYDTGPAGTPTSEIMNQMRLIMPGLQYQNWAMGSQTYSWVNGTGFKAAYTDYALKANAWLLLAGVNDINTGRTWAQVQADLDAIRLRCVAGDLWICEITPWTAGNDAQAATLRTFNANIAAWCAANNAHLIACHDAMAQVRASTGQLDDILTAYDQDGIHFKQAGVNKMAALIKAALATAY